MGSSSLKTIQGEMVTQSIGMIVCAIIVIGVIIGVILYLKKSKETDLKNGISEIKSKSIMKTFAIILAIGIVITIIGIGNLSDSSKTMGYQKKQDLNKWGTIALVAGIGIDILSVVYLNVAKTKETQGDSQNKSNVKNTTKEENNISKKLEDLKRLADNGTITQEEFENKKQELLKKM